MRVSVVATGIDAGQLRDAGGNVRPADHYGTSPSALALPGCQRSTSRQPGSARRRGPGRPGTAADPAARIPADAAAGAGSATRGAGTRRRAYRGRSSCRPRQRHITRSRRSAAEEQQPQQRTQGQRVEGAYIAPRPISAGPRPTIAPPRPPLPPAPATPEGKKQGLFERMLGPRQPETAAAPVRQTTPARPAQAQAPSPAQSRHRIAGAAGDLEIGGRNPRHPGIPAASGELTSRIGNIADAKGGASRLPPFLFGRREFVTMRNTA